MSYRRSRSKIRLSPGIEKLIVIFILALCLLAEVALFSSIGDFELPWLQLEEKLPEENLPDVIPPGDNEASGTDPSPELPETPEDPPEVDEPIETPKVDWEGSFDTPFIDITRDSRPVRLPVE